MEDLTAERTFIAVKPDGVQRGFIGDIIKRFEVRGFKLVAAKFLWASRELVCEHYQDVADRPYFDGMVDYVSSGQIFIMVWEGKCAVKTGRKMLGVTDPMDSQQGTIRGDFCIDIKRTACHASDSVEAARREIALWFRSYELCGYELSNKCCIYE